MTFCMNKIKAIENDTRAKKLKTIENDILCESSKDCRKLYFA